MKTPSACRFSPHIDESILEGEDVAAYVVLACSKAQVVLEKFPDAIVIAADTSLRVDDQILGKPESKQHAFEMWQRISGRKHDVFSGGQCVQ